MNFKKILSEAIDNDIKIIVTGKSGWGKSEMITQVAQEKEMELIDFRLSEVLPEDLVGIPKVVGEYYEYIPPKWLYEVINNPDKKYLLFLDEITQGTPEVLNICYKLFDKVTKVGDHELLNVSVVGATNYSHESDYLTELPSPLKKRSCMLELDHCKTTAANYLIDKHQLGDDTILKKVIEDVVSESNPRSVDKSISLIKNNCHVELVIPYIGFEFYQKIKSVLTAAVAPEGITNLTGALLDIKSGFVNYNGGKFKLIEPEILSYHYGLTDEEMTVVKNEWPNLKRDVTGIPRDFFTIWASNNPDITGEQLIELKDMKSFNGLRYISKMKINEKTMTNQFEALKHIMDLDSKGLLKIMCERRTLTIQVMKLYRDLLPWDMLRVQARNNYFTENKLKEFEKELAL